MRIDVIPLDYVRLDQDSIRPTDSQLWSQAQDYMSRELAIPFDPSRMAKTWVAKSEDGICGITSFVMVPDITHFRVSGPNAARATKMLTDRLQSYFADQGLRGGYVLLHISSKETPEQRCYKWDESLKAAGAIPADRFSVEVR